MKLIIAVFLLFAIACCIHRPQQQEPTAKAVEIPKPEKQSPPYEISNDSSIRNTSGKKIFLLYNSMEDRFIKSDSLYLFSTECMMCEPLDVYNDHFVYAHQLEIFDSSVRYSVRDLALSGKTVHLARTNIYDDRKPLKFRFSGGTAEMKYIKMSCNDADFYDVTLNYPSGSIKLNNVLNAEFFEYDLDKDGMKEQYILSTRNCTQEIALLKIR